MMMMMLEVVKCVGVLKVIVFCVFLGNGYVSQEIKDCVFQVVEESGYCLNLLVCNLLVKSIQMLGLVVINMIYYGIYFSELFFYVV